MINSFQSRFWEFSIMNTHENFINSCNLLMAFDITKNTVAWAGIEPAT